MRLPHPVLLLVAGTVLAACLTWFIPAGQFDRRDDPATGRRVVVAGTYHAVPPAPVGPFATIVALPRGFAATADVAAVILFVGGAWVVAERAGVLASVVSTLASALRGNGLMAVPLLSLFFGTMGALANMQEEIIPLMPVLLLLGRALGIDAVSVLSMSAGAAMIGSAFGPTNPFQAGIAAKLAGEPPQAGATLRLVLFLVGLALWIALTLRHAARHRTVVDLTEHPEVQAGPRTRAWMALSALLGAMGVYVVGALRFDWGFNELTAAFLVGGASAGLIAGLTVAETTTAFFEGMQSLVPAAIMVGTARSLSLVLEDGHVIDTILEAFSAALSHVSPASAALLMVPFHALVHIAVPSISGQAVLTMPLMVPLADLLHLSRQVPILAYQVGGGLMELLTPTNGSLMAMLLASGVPYSRWMRFAAVAVGLEVVLGVLALLVAAR